jgi:predicted nucleic acid-binding protein
MTKSPLRVICDSGPIIHLDELDCLDLLNDFKEIILPATVTKEIKRNRKLALEKIRRKFIELPGKKPRNEQLLTMCQVFSLDIGEIEALAVLEKYSNAMFLTDDAAARLVAERMGFKVHGTIGLLVRSIRRRQRKPLDVLKILSDIPNKSTLYLKTSLLEDAKMRIRKEFGL